MTQLSILILLLSLQQVQHWLTRASPEEYDLSLARTPDVCRPFAAAMGDRRSARSCIADGSADAARTLAALAATPDGALRLELLAAAIDARLGLQS
jgi:hypothetical protein